MPARILTVEDDDRIRAGLRLALEGEGWSVSEAGTGEEALVVMGREPPALVLVDLMLPGMSGFEVVRSIRVLSDIPIVIVTARTDSHDVVVGLEAGADDYVRKPFALSELLARIRVLLRRAEPGASPRGEQQPILFGEFELRPEAGSLRRDGEEVRLTKTEFQLLHELTRRPGTVLSREQLLETVWGYGYFGDVRLVDAHVHRLRMKIEEDPTEPTLIVTVRGFGYKLDL